MIHSWIVGRLFFGSSGISGQRYPNRLGNVCLVAPPARMRASPSIIHPEIPGRAFSWGRRGTGFGSRSQPDMHSHADAERARNTSGRSVYWCYRKILYMPGSFR